ncbi:MAG TPA: hypothetical protein VNL17_14610 [Verrucomicrobiae bacterium]|nr:hypothetical protein [Verrucomicrobiae bacterium]
MQPARLSDADRSEYEAMRWAFWQCTESLQAGADLRIVHTDNWAVVIVRTPAATRELVAVVSSMLGSWRHPHWTAG